MKKLIEGIFKRKKEEPEVKPDVEVPDELPELAQSVIKKNDGIRKEDKKTDASRAESSLQSNSSSATMANAENIPDELPSISLQPDKNQEEKPELNSQNNMPKGNDNKTQASINNMQKENIPEMKDSHPNENDLTIHDEETHESLSSPIFGKMHPKKNLVHDGDSVNEHHSKHIHKNEEFAAKLSKLHSNEEGFFSSLQKYLADSKLNGHKLLSDDLFQRMNDYWSIEEKNNTKAKQMLNENHLKHELFNELTGLQKLEKRWKTQKLLLEEDKRQLDEREQEIKEKASAVKHLAAKMRLYEDVGKDNHFKMYNGVIIKSFKELIETLQVIDNETFKYHVNGMRNDFSNWVRYVLKDPQLAENLSSVYTREAILNCLLSYFNSPSINSLLSSSSYQYDENSSSKSIIHSNSEMANHSREHNVNYNNHNINDNIPKQIIEVISPDKPGREIKKEDDISATQKKEGNVKTIKPENYFYLHDGKVIKSLHELLESLKNIDEQTFKCHVNEHKNDFSSWLKDVLGEHSLAKKIEKVENRESTAHILEKFLNEKVS